MRLGIENISLEQLKKASEYAIISSTAKISSAKLGSEDLYKNMLVADEIANKYLCR